MLIMKYVGKEGSLGLIQGISGGLTAILIYLLGRFAKPKHRILIFGFGITLFLVGTVVNGIELSIFGVMVFVLCKVFFQPLHDLAYYPIMMKVIDVVSKLENRNPKQIRSTKPQSTAILIKGIRASSLLRISKFGFRISARAMRARPCTPGAG